MADPLPVLRSRTLENAGFSHGFSTREGGVSEPPYESLDFAILRDPGRLLENQRRLAAAVGFDAGRLFQTHQVHGRVLVVAEGSPAAMIGREADALVGEPGTRDAVAVRVADCVPVLLADPATGRVAAVHAGWRGIVAGVVVETVRHMAGEGGMVREGGAGGLLAAIGPSIGPCCFEVGADVGETIAAAATPGVIARRDQVRTKVFVDLRRAVRAQLLGLGLVDASIDDVPDATRAGCTRCDAKRFYSFRRDGELSGRLLAVIVPR